MKMKSPVPPVTAQFSADGVMLTAIEKGAMYHYVMPWREIYKLAKKKGKKMKPEGFLKKAADKMDEMVAAVGRSAAESARLTETLKRPLPTSPMPPVMPVPPYRSVRATPVEQPVPVMPPPTASEM